jgi:hypothetical protein
MSATQTDNATSNGRPKKTANERLDELRRALQRQLNRKPTMVERALLDRAALMMLRAEMAARDPASKSDDVVRLDNVSRRALNDFARVAGIDTARKKVKPSMADIEREIARHV